MSAHLLKALKQIERIALVDPPHSGTMINIAEIIRAALALDKLRVKQAPAMWRYGQGMWDSLDDVPMSLREVVVPLYDSPKDPEPNMQLLGWAIMRWEQEVSNRPLVNVHRRSLDDTWRQVIRYAGGDPDVLLGPTHDERVRLEGLTPASRG